MGSMYSFQIIPPGFTVALKYRNCYTIAIRNSHTQWTSNFDLKVACTSLYCALLIYLKSNQFINEMIGV